ncbi:hypothetical protein EAI_11776, partial [Harpegnathos saltator]
IDINTDGCSLDKSSTIQIWPIQCRLVNMRNIKPIVVGIYKGAHKPNDPVAFFEKLIADVTALISKGGVYFRVSLLPIKLRSFITDAPARAFI